MSGPAATPAVGVAIVSRNRRDLLLSTIARLRMLPERPPVVVADNGSDDGTVEAVHATFGDDPGVRVLALAANRGCGARTDAARALRTPLVAFCDDDSWWDPGALSAAAELFAAHPRLGLLAARILVGPERRLDPTCAEMAASPLPREDDGPGMPVLGFVACGAIVRREAFLAVGGFDGRYGIGGEERLLALDLAAAGWQLRYVEDVVAHHWPRVAAGGGDRAGRDATVLRNDLWSSWLRRPAHRIPAATLRTLRTGAAPPQERLRATAAAARGLPWILRERRTVPPPVERAVRALETASER